ncbi:MAG: choice-of-anchor L domain-containing protein [Bacteroidota bacterium]
MKALFGILLFSTVLFSSTARAQGIEYGIVTDYPTLIANIFGIQCEGVTNVQVISSPQSIGRFENGQDLGLTSGLTMSTGILYGSNQPSGTFFSYTMGTPFDNDIANFGSMAGQNPVNYDACSIQFDFDPIVSDTITFSYVFASEEYPEYSMSNFTDRFLFLVSTNGGPASNIAFIPGTTTPVEINSINQYVNTQYYIDNTTSGLPTMANFVYDGYTTPLTAKFWAHQDSTYHIKLVLADVADALFDSAIFLDEQEAYNNIAGTVNVNNAPATGTLEIFNFIQDTTLAIPVETVNITNGDYDVDSLGSGMYHVRFTPDPVIYPNTPPVYFTTGSDWTSATAIGLPCFLSNAGVFSDSLAVLNGNSTIAGFISIDTSYLKVVYEAMDHALIFLHDSLTNELIDFTYSDVNGMYQFNNLPAGDYYVRLDVPYIPQLDNHTLTVGTNEVLSGADFQIMLDGIHPVSNLVLSTNEMTDFVVDVYPNPATDAFYIESNGNSYSYELLTINGASLEQGSAVGTKKIDISTLSSGIYLLKVSNGNCYRIVKK